MECGEVGCDTIFWAPSNAHRTLYEPTTIRLVLGQIAKHAGSHSVTFPSRRPSRMASREDLTVESLWLSRELDDEKNKEGNAKKIINDK